MKKRVEYKSVDVEFEVDKTYKTKFQTGELFTIKKILRRPKTDTIIRFEGIYESHKHIGICPLEVDRLYPETKKEMIEIEICECCGKDI